MGLDGAGRGEAGSSTAAGSSSSSTAAPAPTARALMVCREVMVGGLPASIPSEMQVAVHAACAKFGQLTNMQRRCIPAAAIKPGAATGALAVQFARVDEALHCWESLQGTTLLPQCPTQLWFSAAQPNLGQCVYVAGVSPAEAPRVLAQVPSPWAHFPSVLSVSRTEKAASFAGSGRGDEQSIF
jgi:hypothetical protein